MTPKPNPTRNRVNDLLRNLDASAKAQIDEYVDDFRASLEYESALNALRLDDERISKDRVVKALERVYTEKFKIREKRQNFILVSGLALGVGAPMLVDHVVKAVVDPAAFSIVALLVAVGLVVGGVYMAFLGYLNL